MRCIKWYIESRRLGRKLSKTIDTLHDLELKHHMLQDGFKRLEKESWDMHCRYIEIRGKYNILKGENDD